MERLANAKHPIHELLQRRWSPRAFAERSVEPEKLRSLLEAARWAPSSFNEQPWSFLAAGKDDLIEYERMLSCLSEGNRKWARTAPLLMISVTAHNFRRNNKPNRHAFHDVGLAVENLVIQATALDLYVHQMAGFDPERAREIYGIPEGSEAVAAIAVGYIGDPQSLPEEFRQREAEPSARKPMADFVFSGHWGRKAQWVTEVMVLLSVGPHFS